MTEFVLQPLVEELVTGSGVVVLCEGTPSEEVLELQTDNLLAEAGLSLLCDKGLLTPERKVEIVSLMQAP